MTLSMQTGIYRIVNVQTGRIYVGSACRFSKRWGEHLRQLRDNRHHSAFLQRAWNKYGEESFSFEKLIVCSRENLIWFEQRFIDALKPAFNVCQIAGSVLGYRHSEENKQAAAERAKGNTHRRGRKESPEYCQMVSERRKGKGCYPCSPEKAKKISDAQKGRPVSEAKKAHLSALNTGKIQSRETVEKRMRTIHGDDWTPRGKSVAETKAGIEQRRLAKCTGAQPKNKLSVETVLAIRKASAQGSSVIQISNIYGLERSIVSRVISRKNYNWVI